MTNNSFWNQDSRQNFLRKINETVPFSGVILFDEPMSHHTSFKTGGPADLYIKPEKNVFEKWTAVMRNAAKQENIPVFFLGGGANLLVSDKGIRGIVLDTGFWEGVDNAIDNEDGGLTVRVLSGTLIDKLLSILADRGLSGLEFLSGMPGSVGGAVWMNARCYEKSISDVLTETEILDENFKIVTVPYNEKDFDYKKSPFQNRDILILSVCFKTEPCEISAIKKAMDGFRKDREEKGHYRFPSAGSIFKNNRSFGEPTGKIIADLGLRGLRKGGAQIAPWHGNFFINTGGATSSEIRFLMEEAARHVKEKQGFDLEPEIRFIGEW